MRRIGRTIVALVTTLTAMVVPATEAHAAEPSIIVEAASILYPPVEMIVNGYSTCSQPTGQARIDVTAFQFSGGFPTAQGYTIIDCGSPLGSWSVTLTTHSLNPWLSGTIVFGVTTLTRAGVEEASTCNCVVAW